MAKMTDRLNRRLAGEAVSDDEDEDNETESASEKAKNDQQSDGSGSGSNGGRSSSSNLRQPPLSRSTTSDSAFSSDSTSSRRNLPFSPRTTSNIQTMQQHMHKSTAAGARVLADDWSVSSIGQSSVSSTSSPTAQSLPPQARRRKPFSGR